MQAKVSKTNDYAMQINKQNINTIILGSNYICTNGVMQAGNGSSSNILTNIIEVCETKHHYFN